MRRSARALDLGTGCGVQALHLAEHADDVVATDVNQRALAMTRLNAALNGVRVDVRAGSLFEPVAREQFDLVVTNPPFVVSPATGERLVYRDSGLPGDEMVRRVVTGAADHLRPGGRAQVLANWVHAAGQPWQERVGGWVEGRRRCGCDAWVVQREVADPAEYVELWLRDAGRPRHRDYVERYDAWLGVVRRAGHRGRRLRLGQPAPRRAGTPVGARSRSGPTRSSSRSAPRSPPGARRTDLLAGHPTTRPARTSWRVRADVRQETVGAPGAADPETIVLRQQRGHAPRPPGRHRRGRLWSVPATAT